MLGYNIIVPLRIYIYIHTCERVTLCHVWQGLSKNPTEVIRNETREVTRKLGTVDSVCNGHTVLLLLVVVVCISSSS